MATEAVPMKNFDMVLPVAICHFCPHQSGENEMRNHIIQSHYDHVSKFWKICKFCARDHSYITSSHFWVFLDPLPPLRQHVFSTKNKQKLAFSDPPPPLQVLT